METKQENGKPIIMANYFQPKNFNMKALNRYLPFRLSHFAFLIAMLFTISSCELEDSVDDKVQYAELEVYVSGTLSGNPRSGLSVTVYDTEEDAQKEVNAVTFSEITDSDGFAFFRGLEPGFRYWVRVNTDLIRNIDRSDVLTTGLNEMSMTIL